MTESIVRTTTFVDGRTPVTADWLNEVKRKTGEIISVADFGAVGDGVTDDAAAIQAACTYATSAGGATVRFETGKTYLINSGTYTIPSYSAIGFKIGSNTTLDLNGATLKAGSGLPLHGHIMSNISGDTALNTRVEQNISIINGTLDGSGRTYPAWDNPSTPWTWGGLTQAQMLGSLGLFVSVDGLSIDNLEVKNHKTLALVFGGNQNLSITNSRFHDNGQVDIVSGGFWIGKSFPNYTQTENVIIDNNTFIDHDRLAFLCGGGTNDVVVSNNIIKNVKEGGMFFPHPISNVTITNNIIDGVTLSDTSGSGIEINDGVGFTISNNIIMNTDRAPLTFVGLSDSVITGNLLKNYGKGTTFPVGPQTVDAGIDGDPVADTYKDGILAFTGGPSVFNNIVITGNRFTDDQGSPTSKYGIYLSQYSTLVTYGNVLVTGNDFRGGAVLAPIGWSGAAYTGSMSVVFKNNIDSFSTTKGHYGHQIQDEVFYREALIDLSVIGRTQFNGENDVGDAVTYGQIQGSAIDVTDGTEDGSLILSTMQNGVLTSTLTIDTGLKVNSGSKLLRLLSTVAALDFGSIAAAGSATLTITVTGAASYDSVALGLPLAPPAGIVYDAWVSATDTVSVKATNITAAPIDPTNQSYRVTVFGF